jgi:hypothetical protein
LARKILDFATETIKQFYNEKTRLIFVVNRAQAYKWSGDDKKASDILKCEDWSAKDDGFKLAEAVLADNFPRALAIVRRIGTNCPISIHDYREWPLFRKLRKQPEFVALFAELFGEPLTQETVQTDEILNQETEQSNTPPPNDALS